MQTQLVTRFSGVATALRRYADDTMRNLRSVKRGKRDKTTFCDIKTLGIRCNKGTLGLDLTFYLLSFLH